MPQTCVNVAPTCALCLLLIALSPPSAGEEEAAPVLAVPGPAPLPRGPAVPPPPPEPEIDPIANLAGKWSGQGTMVPISGRNEQFRCIITYAVGEAAAHVRQHLRCQGDSRNFDAVTRLDIHANKVTGVWAENIHAIGGTLTGHVTEKGFHLQLRSAFFDAKMSVVVSHCQQTIKVVPDDRSGFMKVLVATLKKC
jgi:hypothetical protein